MSNIELELISPDRLQEIAFFVLFLPSHLVYFFFLVFILHYIQVLILNLFEKAM